MRRNGSRQIGIKPIGCVIVPADHMGLCEAITYARVNPNHADAGKLVLDSIKFECAGCDCT